MKTVLTLLLSTFFANVVWAENALVLQSDFGTRDGAVASMKGVAFAVSPGLGIYDLTHEIPVFNVWEAAYRLLQTAEDGLQGTGVGSGVEPGVGTERKSVIRKIRTR